MAVPPATMRIVTVGKTMHSVARMLDGGERQQVWEPGGRGMTQLRGVPEGHRAGDLAASPSTWPAHEDPSTGRATFFGQL
jgi:hypothetical protein